MADRTNSERVDDFDIVQEIDNDTGAVEYCVEKEGKLLYSCLSKALAFAFIEGRRSRRGEGKSGEGKSDGSGDGDKGNKGASDKPPVVNPDQAARRQRKVF